MSKFNYKIMKDHIDGGFKIFNIKTGKVLKKQFTELTQAQKWLKQNRPNSLFYT